LQQQLGLEFFFNGFGRGSDRDYEALGGFDRGVMVGYIRKNQQRLKGRKDADWISLGRRRFGSCRWWPDVSISSAAETR